MNSLDTNVLSLIFSHLNYIDASNCRLTCKKMYHISNLPLTLKRWRKNNVFTTAYKRIIRHNYEGEYMPGFTYLVVISSYRKGKGVVKQIGSEYVLWCKEDDYSHLMKYALDANLTDPLEIEEFERKALEIAYHVSKR